MGVGDNDVEESVSNLLQSEPDFKPTLLFDCRESLSRTLHLFAPNLFICKTGKLFFFLNQCHEYQIK